ncbi:MULTISPECIES: MFS transporter [unclassified Rhodococcus (in: high G+C Gram-positive bacteria)]|uniref:MFS transporter n=1 Tax=unclassified Rhodococcus (in: high G+C Gram-positive bacteria) TaxID=192944 RepID=UPI000A810834|nr:MULTISPECIES: MFS transporter [unclassified Rhodococcus (in: high G+C Gram-positive bacteria)]
MSRVQRYTTSTAGRWAMLVIGMLATASTALLLNGAAFLIPALRDQRGLSLASAGLVVAMPTAGIVLTLFAWGAVVDRVGERRSLIAGSVLTSVAAFCAAATESTVALAVFLLLGGMAAASVNSATGRVVVGWFPPHRRGLAMGIRQMSLPLGVALSALLIPGIARDHGVGAAMLLPAVASALSALACLVGVFDPPRPSRSAASSADLLANPYRGRRDLWRIHGASVALVVPQYVVWTFALVWLVDQRAWSPEAAGVLITVSQILGAGGRIAAGAVSDRVGSRLGPMRWVAVGVVAVMAALAIADAAGLAVSVVILVVASVATVSPNGLAFTAVAERAGPFWSGRALGAQNTSQFIAASAVPPVFGALITHTSYAVAFGVSAAIALLAVPTIPREARDRLHQ